MTETEQLADIIALSVHAATEPLIAQNIALEAKVQALEARPSVPGRDGKDADLSVLDAFRSEISALRAEVLAIKAWPVPKDGRDGIDGKSGDVGPVGPVGPQGLPGRDGANGLNGKDADLTLIHELQAQVKALQAELLHTKAMPIDGQITSIVAAQLSQMPVPRDGRDGKDIDPVVIDAMVHGAVQHAMKSIQPPKDGTSVTVADVAPLITDEVERAVKAIPIPKDGQDGKDVSLETVQQLVRSEVVEHVLALPVPKDGASVTVKDVEPLIKAEVDRLFRSVPVPKDGIDGKSVTVSDVEPLIADVVTKAIAAIPLPKDGRDGIDGKDGIGKDGKDGTGLQSMRIDGNGHLVAVLTDGKEMNIGRVTGEPGRDGQPGLPGWRGEKGDPGQDGKHGRDGKNGTDGINGKDALGFEDLSFAFESSRGWIARFSRGELVKEFVLGVPFDAGVWKAGSYPKGAAVTRRGSLFIAQRETSATPDENTPESRDWRLAVKSGRDGKPGRDGKDFGFDGGGNG